VFEQYGLPDHVKKRVIVLGVGNSLFGDDGFGSPTVQFILRSMEVPSDVCVLDVGMGITPVLFDIMLIDVTPKRLITLDTVDLGKRPGELLRVDVEQLPQTRGSVFSFHALSARGVLQTPERLKERGSDHFGMSSRTHPYRFAPIGPFRDPIRAGPVSSSL